MPYQPTLKCLPQENRTRATPVCRLRSKREVGQCKKERNEVLGMWLGWPFLHKLLQGTKTPEEKLPSKDQKGGIQENPARGTQAWRKTVGDPTIMIMRGYYY